MRVFMFALAMVAMFTPGCFALARGPDQQVRFVSNPPGARVLLHGESAVTPCVLTVPRSSKPRMLRVTLADHDSVQIELAPTYFNSEDHVGAGMLLGVDCTFLIPILVDLGFYDRFWDWPLEITATLMPKASKIWITREGARH